MNDELLVNPLLHRPLPIGGWLDYWIQNTEAVGDFVRKNELQPVSAAAIPAAVGEIGSTANANVKSPNASRHILDPGIRGGIHVPHLHCDGNMFMLNDKQWGEFSSKIISEAKAKLVKVNVVNFDQAMSVVRTTQTLS